MRLKSRIERLESQSRNYAKRLNRLECPHSKTRWVPGNYYLGGYCTRGNWNEQCINCGANLRTDVSRAEYCKVMLGQASKDLTKYQDLLAKEAKETKID